MDSQIQKPWGPRESLYGAPILADSFLFRRHRYCQAWGVMRNECASAAAAGWLAAAPAKDLERQHDICNGNGGTLNQLSGTNEDCEVTPDIQKVIFYSLHMCQSKPTGPTINATVDLSDCQEFYKDADGNTAEVINGTASIIGDRSNYTAIDNATYSHAVVVMGSIFTFKSVLNFTRTMSDGVSTSTRCVTQTSTNEPIYGMETTARLDTTAEKNIVCDDTQAAQEAQVGVNLLTNDLSLNDTAAIS